MSATAPARVILSCSTPISLLLHEDRAPILLGLLQLLLPFPLLLLPFPRLPPPSPTDQPPGQGSTDWPPGQGSSPISARISRGSSPTWSSSPPLVPRPFRRTPHEERALHGAPTTALAKVILSGSGQVSPHPSRGWCPTGSVSYSSSEGGPLWSHAIFAA